MKLPSPPKALIALAACLLALALCACGEESVATGQDFDVHYLNNDDSGIVTRTYHTDSEDTDAIVAELIAALATPSDKFEYKCPLTGGFSLLSHSVSAGQVFLDVNEQYRDLPTVTEILTRAALVRTLTQVRGVNTLTMTVRGEPLTDSSGAFIGAMDAAMFIDNVGSEMNTYTKTDLRLYFGYADGLKAIYRPDVVYNSNMPIERLIIESLIAGPLEAEEAIAAIHPDTRIISVTSTDGTCYVNLDDNFTHPLPGVSPEMAIYSITNSLAELPSISRVRISVGGETPVVFETMNLAVTFERNLDIVR